MYGYKKKLTTKELRDYARVFNKKVIAIGYCGAQYLLRGLEPYGYNSGVYGWNFDAYSTDGAIITTGYRNLVGDRPANLEEYERRAYDIAHDRAISYDEQNKLLDALRAEFIAQA